MRACIRPRRVLPVVLVIAASPSILPPSAVRDASSYHIPPRATTTDDRGVVDGNDELLDDERIVVVETETTTTMTTTGMDGGGGTATSATARSQTSSSSSPLALARNLRVPHAIGMVDAEFEHHEFWEDNGRLLRDAWAEWEGTAYYSNNTKNKNGAQWGRGHTIDHPDDGIIADELSAAIDEARAYPSEEAESHVRSLWTGGGSSHHPDDVRYPRGVYATRLLSTYGIRVMRNLLDSASVSGIPTRRPNGMNRRGVILDPNVDGAISTRSLISMVEDAIVDRIARPVGRMLYPDGICRGDDVEHFAFTVRYDDGRDVGDERHDAHRDDGRDVELMEHRDASVVTLNINLNLPHEEYSGSEVYFREYPPHPEDDDGGIVRFTPGMAIMHLGSHRHGSVPISASSGGSNGGHAKRYNLVIWLFGTGGDVRVAPCEEGERMNVVERWRGSNHANEYGFKLQGSSSLRNC
jgi:hypothetical protein